MTTTFKTKEITTIDSLSCKILENKKTGEWIQVRYTEKYKDGYIVLWVFSGSLLQNDDTLGFENLEEICSEWLIVIE